MVYSKKIVSLLFLALLIFSHCGKSDPKPDQPKPQPPEEEEEDNPIYAAETYKDKATYIFDLIMDKYRVEGTNFLAENYPRQTGDKAVAYMWPYSGVVTGVGILRQLGLEDERFSIIDKGIDQYWSDKNSLTGLESFPPALGGGTRFYDDNATAGLDYLENYAATSDVHYLNQAIQCLEFDYTGETADCGGGLFWNEDEKWPGAANYIKATCSSAFATTLSLKLYQYTNDQEQLDFGLRMYDWLKTHLQDPFDLIYWNDLSVGSCEPNTVKWTYNSGAMLSNAVLLFQITQDEKYLEDAKELAAATFKFFTVSSDKVGRRFPDHDSWFNIVLFRGYLDLYDVDPDKNTEYIDAFVKNVDYAWRHARTSEGFFYEDWSGAKRGRSEWLLHQACMIEVYGRIAIYKNEK